LKEKYNYSRMLRIRVSNAFKCYCRGRSKLAMPNMSQPPHAPWFLSCAFITQ